MPGLSIAMWKANKYHITIQLFLQLIKIALSNIQYITQDCKCKHKLEDDIIFSVILPLGGCYPTRPPGEV
jgi:hypothetical protein